MNTNRSCSKCGGKIPKNIWIDDKKKYTSIHRRFCFECSPFGSHNTKDLNRKEELDSNGRKLYPTRKCPECGKEHRKRGIVCQVCVARKKTEKTKQKVIGVVGNQCWICGYDKTFFNLCFHHVNSQDKTFGLSIREITGYAWNRVLSEIKKCIFVCQNCHGEIHDNLIEKSKVEKLWTDKWNIS